MGNALSYVAIVNDVPNCQMWEWIGPNQNALGWAMAGFTGAVSGMSGAPGLTGELAEIMVPFLDVLGDSVAFEYDPTALATYAQKTGRTADLQAISMPFLDQYARTQLHLNGAPGYGGTYLSNKVTLSLIMQANTMAVVRTSATTADLYVGAWTVWSGPTGGYKKYYYLSQNLKNLHKTSLSFIPKPLKWSKKGGPAIVGRRFVELDSSNTTISALD